MKKYKIVVIIAVVLIIVSLAIILINESKKNPQLIEEGEEKFMNIKNRNEIYLAGGCFWGVEGYFKKIPGVLDTSVGYANGKTKDTTYREVKDTDHSETVKIIYDGDKVSLQELLEHYFRIIDPTSVNLSLIHI